MSAQALNDLNARRRSSGQFGEKLHADPGLTLGGVQATPAAQSIFARGLAQEGIDRRALLEESAEIPSVLRRKLLNSRGLPGGRIRKVSIGVRNTWPRSGPVSAMDVMGPEDGRPIVIETRAGQPFLRVAAGKAVIFASAPSLLSTHKIEVENGAEAVIFAGGDSEVSVYARQGSKVTVVSPGSGDQFSILDASGTVTERFGPEAITVPECPDCGEPMEYGSCRDCLCSCGQPAAEGPDPNLCADCNEEATAAAAGETEADNRRASAALEAMRKINEEWRAAMTAAKHHNVPQEVRWAVSDLVNALHDQPFGKLNAAAEWAESRGYETGYLSYGAEVDSIHQHGAIFVDEDGDWEIAVTGVGRRNSSLDSAGNRGQMDYEGDENGEISPLQYILPWKKDQP